MYCANTRVIDITLNSATFDTQIIGLKPLKNYSHERGTLRYGADVAAIEERFYHR